MLRKIMQRTYNLTPLIGISLSQTLYACILLLLIIAIKKQCKESKLLAILYIVIGFSAALSMFLYYRFPGLPFSVALLSPNSNLAMAGAFMVAIGVTSMIPFFKSAGNEK
jgi:hypothetical protein